eukprot:765744_1
MDLASGTWNESEEGPVITEIESDEHDSESSSDDDQDTPISQMLQNNDNKNKSVEPSESEEEVETEMETDTPLHDTVNLTGEESGDDTMHENVNHQQNGFNMKSEDGVDLNPTHHTSKHASQTRLKTYTQRLKSFAYENEIEAVTWPPPKPQTTAARNTKSTTQDNEINRIPKKKQTTRITYKTRANEKSEMDTDPKKQTHSNVKVDIFTMMQRLKPNKYVLGDTQSLARYERRFDRMMDRIVNAKREMMRKAKEFDTALTPNGAEALCNIYTDDAFSELTDFRAYFHHPIQ